MIAVLLDSSHGLIAYGPFDEDDREVAEQFARFLTAVVDPAKVVPLSEVGPARPLTWGSVVRELLAFYERPGQATP